MKRDRHGGTDEEASGKDRPILSSRPPRKTDRSKITKGDNSSPMMLGPHFKVGKKIGSGNFGELRLGLLRNVFHKYLIM